jgi:RNA polymerase sigma factor (sigma-70 family)
MVYHVCRRVLYDAHDAEDAFQAVFLILARKAATLHNPAALPAWLHGVARRVAGKTRRAEGHRDNAQGWADPAECADPGPDPPGELAARELSAALEEELQRLPETYRLAVIVCCLEGLSLTEAAERLGWTVGSVKGRLERARARLHQRLARRGRSLAAAFAALALTQKPATAAVLSSLFLVTVKAASRFVSGAAGAGIAPRVAVLVEGEVLALSLGPWRIVLWTILAAGLLTAGLGNSGPGPTLIPSRAKAGGMPVIVAGLPRPAEPTPKKAAVESERPGPGTAEGEAEFTSARLLFERDESGKSLTPRVELKIGEREARRLAWFFPGVRGPRVGVRGPFSGWKSSLTIIFEEKRDSVRAVHVNGDRSLWIWRDAPPCGERRVQGRLGEWLAEEKITPAKGR